MGLFKKKFTVKETSYIFVHSLYEDLEQTFPTLVNRLTEISNKSVGENLLSTIDENSLRFFFLSRLTLELEMITKILGEGLGKDLLGHILYSTSDLLQIDMLEVTSLLDKYRSCFLQGVSKNKELPDIYTDPIEELSNSLYEDMNIGKVDLDDSVNIPNSFITTFLSQILVVGVGNYVKEIKKTMKIVSD